MSSNSPTLGFRARTNILQWALFAIFIIFGVRLFYIQVLKGSYYSQLALANQRKQYEITPERGSIYAVDGGKVVPLVLNEKRYRLVADPSLIKKVDETAAALAEFSNPADIKTQLNIKTSRYEILAKKISKDQAEKIRELELAGVFLEETPQRVYPQGSLAAGILGFVDDDGVGKYGIEQALDKEMHGENGQVKAITDHNGVPLLASGDNVLVPAKDGTDIVLSVDISLQRQVEEILKAGLEAAKSASGGVVVLRTNGEVAAMASYPTYDPAKYSDQKDPNVFINSNVGTPYEVGSIMKPLTVAAALDSGSVTPDTSFFDPGFVRVDDATVTNVEEVGGSGVRNLEAVLVLSLNTGATKMLQYMGGGDINSKARNTWHDYMVDHYQLGKVTNIEQGYESEGIIPDPEEGFGLNITFANTAFGQGMTATPLQMAAAMASVVNGGNYYQPTLVRGYRQGEVIEPKEPKLVRSNVVSEQFSKLIISYMESVVDRNLASANKNGYMVGGKTGTAQIANPAGGYFDDKFNGSYMGFVGGDNPEYIIVVRVDQPGIAGYAGSKAAAPIFSNVSNLLINNFNVPSRAQ
ncbi:MAG: penicillin-binding protein 2 [bacterium]|nr:penicillin-binding protein 2 [bacterium]